MIRRNKPLLGTFVEITILDDRNDSLLITEKMYRKIEKMELIFSYHNKESELYKINQIGKPIVNLKLSPQMAKLLKIAQKFSKLSDGIFDVTAEPYIYNKNIGCYKNIFINKNLLSTNMPIIMNLGGIAKGFIVDVISQKMLKMGLKNFIVNAGGDMYVASDVTQKIAIRDPFDYAKIVKYIQVKNCAIATSTITGSAKLAGGMSCAVYRNSNKKPINQHVTIVSKKCVVADILTKIYLLTNNIPKKIKKFDFNIENNKIDCNKNCINENY
jgi:thiamine biosynthesis lipoprotein